MFSIRTRENKRYLKGTCCERRKQHSCQVFVLFFLELHSSTSSQVFTLFFWELPSCISSQALILFFWGLRSCTSSQTFILFFRVGAILHFHCTSSWVFILILCRVHSCTSSQTFIPFPLGGYTLALPARFSPSGGTLLFFHVSLVCSVLFTITFEKVTEIAGQHGIRQWVIQRQ